MLVIHSQHSLISGFHFQKMTTYFNKMNLGDKHVDSFKNEQEYIEDMLLANFFSIFKYNENFCAQEPNFMTYIYDIYINRVKDTTKIKEGTPWVEKYTKLQIYTYILASFVWDLAKQDYSKLSKDRYYLMKIMFNCIWTRDALLVVAWDSYFPNKIRRWLLPVKVSSMAHICSFFVLLKCVLPYV